MERAVTTPVANTHSWFVVMSGIRAEAPALLEWAGAFSSALLLIFSFPDFNFFFLAWIGLVPLLVVVARRPSTQSAFVLGLFCGFLFFYFSCYWLTYSMIHYGGLSPVVAYILLVPAALVVAVFPALFASVLALAIRRWGRIALLFAPFLWTAFEWARLAVTGQLWNALGYSQAYHPGLIQSASIGGVYLESFWLVGVSAALALVLSQRDRRAIAAAAATIGFVSLALVLTATNYLAKNRELSATSSTSGYLNVVAVQPNVPMSPVKSAEENQELIDRHLIMSSKGLQQLGNDTTPRLVIWPESPMNFTYGTDPMLQALTGKFARENHTFLLLNSLEAAPRDGGYNSALLINEEGRQISQYDKIRLMPFGEYVPLPQWLGGSLISAIVGDFTAGDKYTLMPLGSHRAGVSICIESAYPWIPRKFTGEGADVLINISNDGYLGPNGVMQQHLANAIFRAVENGRPLLSVTNSGITAFVSANGTVKDPTTGFVSGVRIWSLSDRDNRQTFYTKYGDVFAALCALITLGVFLLSLRSFRRDRLATNG